MSEPKEMKTEEAGSFPIQYIEDLARELTIYLSLVIAQVFHGLAKNIDPKNTGGEILKKALLKAGIIDRLKMFGNKLRGYVGLKAKSPKEPFTVRGLQVYVQGKPLTQGQYEDLERQVSEYMKPYLSTAAEEMAVKTTMLAMASAQAEANGQSMATYGTANIREVEKKYYGGKPLPDTIASTVQRYKLPKSVEKSMVQSYDRAAMYCTRMDSDMREAVRSQIVNAHEKNLTPTELASNLYWDVQKSEELQNKYTAEFLMRDWRRIAYTETAMIHNDAKLTSIDEAIDGPVYFAFIGGTCEFCRQHQGTIMRLLRGDEIGSEDDDSLVSRGIEDKYATIGTWPGKNNVGFKRAAWRVCCPAHPWNKAQYVMVNPQFETFDPEKGRFRRSGLEKFYPKDIIVEKDTAAAANRERLDAQIRDAKEHQWKKDIEYYNQGKNAKVVGNGIVEKNGQRYKSVPQQDFATELEKWRSDRSLPIPVGESQREHAELFE